MDLIIGRDNEKKIKAVKPKVKKVVSVNVKSIETALLDLHVLLGLVYANKPCMEIYDAQVHLSQLTRSIAAAKLV